MPPSPFPFLPSTFPFHPHAVFEPIWGLPYSPFPSPSLPLPVKEHLVQPPCSHAFVTWFWRWCDVAVTSGTPGRYCRAEYAPWIVIIGLCHWVCLFCILFVVLLGFFPSLSLYFSLIYLFYLSILFHGFFFLVSSRLFSFLFIYSLISLSILFLYFSSLFFFLSFMIFLLTYSSVLFTYLYHWVSCFSFSVRCLFHYSFIHTFL